MPGQADADRASPASPRRSTCCSASATRPTASPSRYHRELRGKRMTTSVLDDIPGLGPVRKKRLVKELGGVASGASGPSSTSCGPCPGCPTTVAEAVYDKIHKPAPAGRTTACVTADPWEAHAGWWQDGLHRRRRPRVRGADPARWPPSTWPAPAGCSTSAAARARCARLAAATGGADGGRRRPDAGPRSPRPRRAGRRAALRPVGRRARCRSPTAPSTPWWPAWCSSTSSDVDAADRRGGPGARARAVASCSS